MLHLLWDCPAVKSLWLDAISYMSSSFKVKFPICPITCLLGKRPGNTPGVTVDWLWTLGCLTIKRLVVMNWKVRKPGCFLRESWLGQFLDLLNMERAACLLKDFDKCMEDYIKVWKRTVSTTALWIDLLVFLFFYMSTRWHSCKNTPPFLFFFLPSLCVLSCMYVWFVCMLSYCKIKKF